MSIVPTHQDVPIPRLQNVVATFEMGITGINLQQLVLKCPFVQYTPKRFAAGVLRLKDPRTTCLVFASGKAVCTGATTEQLAQMASLKFVLLLQKQGVNVNFCNFKVQNIVSAAHCNFKVDLRKLADTVNGFCSYEPALFPGLMYRVQVPATPGSKTNLVVFIVFQSGKCVITGGKNRNQIMACWIKFFRDTLLHYKSVVDYGNSGNYRMCQISQRRCVDICKLRCLAHLETKWNSKTATTTKADISHTDSLWPKHTWNLDDNAEHRLMHIIDPQYAHTSVVNQTSGAKPSTEALHYVTPTYKAELRLLDSLDDPRIADILNIACKRDRQSEDLLKQASLYAEPREYEVDCDLVLQHGNSITDNGGTTGSLDPDPRTTTDSRGSARKGMHKRRKLVE